MLCYSGRLLGLAEEPVADAGVGNDEITGTLTVSAPETLLTHRVPRLLTLYHERHPRVRWSVRPSAVRRLMGSMRRAVEEGGVDVAFALDEPVEVGSLCVEPLLEEGVSVISAPEHALALTDSVVPEDLSGETILLPEASEAGGCAYRAQFERQLGAAGWCRRRRWSFRA